MAPKIAIVFYSIWGNIQDLALAEAQGIEEAGGTADLYRIPETLPQEILEKMSPAPPHPAVKELPSPTTLETYDGILFGIPTRYGNMPAQWKTWWDATGSQWQNGKYFEKYVGVFVSTGGAGGGQESTALAMMSTFAHHGMIYKPLGSKTTFPQQTNLDEVRGGSSWGAGTFAGHAGVRRPTELELSMARQQGRDFFRHLERVRFE
ncbi:uncharacterized protein MYCFIDRAFT_65308 [Pseudocercospora fijiensis CIRAD86]|uniref:Flavodoxin-like domain-containing protein n=1 Tax=Pseudocercospora fijiensis (strain CIRAD86) TaxID=383855 RepID=M3AN69_PSEFD|nr:uncharacterized protein MYCFIDRAFT_65308 [Pseudocercospora fijiensis CIRAD86]EME78907.1 hypothetical protein MYCFIDRAFT_65308 [Pseudocercospora fijiensis CIRAD86]